jgi:hypothetical protein
MTDHTTAAQAVGSSVTAVTLAAIGLPHLALVWGFVGAAVAIVLTPPESKERALLTVFASGLVGAAGGSAAADYIAGQAVASGSVLVVASLLIGAGAKPLLQKGIEVITALLDRIGGKGGQA